MSERCERTSEWSSTNVPIIGSTEPPRIVLTAQCGKGDKKNPLYLIRNPPGKSVTSQARSTVKLLTYISKEVKER